MDTTPPVPFLRESVASPLKVDGFFDVRLAFSIKVTGWHQDNTLTQILRLSGDRSLGEVTAYKWIGNTAPNFDTPVPDDLMGTDWQKLQSPPDVPKTESNDFDKNGRWHGEEAQFYLVRFSPKGRSPVGDYRLDLRVGAVSGAV